jgi:hypothetical protein
MKTNFRLLNSFLVVAVFLCINVSAGCKKDSKDEDEDPITNKDIIWDSTWLIGTWEGSTPATVSPFANTKIRIVIDKVNLESHDTISGNSSDVWAYGGTFTWDVDGTPWSMKFDHTSYPLPGYNIIEWNCVNVVQAGQTMNNISLRIGDTIQLDPWHSIDLDWGPLVSGTKVAPSYLDFYGDAEIEINGVLNRAEYPPEAGKMIRLTKK